VQIIWSHALHLNNAWWLEGRVFLVVRPQAEHGERDSGVRWCVWIGDQQTDLMANAVGSVRHVRQKQGKRFQEEAVMWAKPRVRGPEPGERWSQMVTVVFTRLILAGVLVESAVRL
jgi:hypothetical protein